MRLAKEFLFVWPPDLRKRTEHSMALSQQLLFTMGDGTSQPRLKPLAKTGNHRLSRDRFRFLDLPAELRNRIYSECNADHRGLAPPAITQLNRLTRIEGMYLFNSQVRDFHANLQSAKSTMKFMDWLRCLPINKTPSIRNMSFQLSDSRTVNLRKEVLNLADLKANFEKSEVSVKSIGTHHYPTVDSSHHDLLRHAAWVQCLGLHQVLKDPTFCITFLRNEKLNHPTASFNRCFQADANWTVYHIEFVGHKFGCLCQEPLADLWKPLLLLDGGDMCQRELGRIGNILFGWDCKMQAARKKAEDARKMEPSDLDDEGYEEGENEDYNFDMENDVDEDEDEDVD